MHERGEKCIHNFLRKILRDEKTLDRRIILKRVLNKYDARVWNGFNWHKIGSSDTV